jgi:hypothetical protein
VTTILDYSYSRPNLDQVKAAGHSGVMRYLSWPNLTPGKIIGSAELASIRSKGLAVGLNWEYDAQDMLGGAAAGTKHATEALRQARALGYPYGCGIVFSGDFDATVAQQTPINAYLRAATDVLRGFYLTGIYGGYWVVKRALDAGAAQWAWQTYAWSGGQWDPRAVLRQVQNGITIGGASCDRNEVHGILPIWWPGVPKPEPKPETQPITVEDDDMKVAILVAKSKTCYLWWLGDDGPHYKIIDREAVLGQLRAACGNPPSVSDVDDADIAAGRFGTEWDPTRPAPAGAGPLTVALSGTATPA